MPLINIHTHNATPNAVNIINSGPNDTIVAIDNYSCGFHPWLINQQFNEETKIIFQQKITQPNCLAIGECGLDKICSTDFNLQKIVFEYQIHLAIQHSKPLIIHAVKSSNEILSILKNVAFSMPVIIHGFNNNEHIAGAYLKNNYSLSFGKDLLIPNSNAQKIITQTPMQNILLETDTIASNQLKDIYEKAAQLLNLNLYDLEKQLEINFERIFTTIKNNGK